LAEPSVGQAGHHANTVAKRSRILGAAVGALLFNFNLAKVNTMAMVEHHATGVGEIIWEPM